MSNMEPTLRDRLASVVNAMGYEFVGCEWLKQDRHRLLRIYMDSEKGVGLDDCSRVSHQLSALFDVEELILGPYSLEVSSPGLDRPLFEVAHYQKQIGNRIKVRVHDRQKFVGMLLRVDGNDIHLLVDEKEIVLPFSDIEKANVITDIR